MLIPADGTKINYRYLSSIISINLVMKTVEVRQECKNISVEGPFIGKYFAILHEDAEKISLMAFGKGLYYGEVTEELIDNPIFSIDKKFSQRMDIPVNDKYILSLQGGSETVRVGDKVFEGCLVFNLIYDKGVFRVALKEGFGLILLQNIVNNIIKDEIRIQEA